MDEQIAKLEKEQEEEERREREKLAQKSKEDANIEKTSVRDEKDVEKEINDIFEHKVESPAVNVNVNIPKEDKKPSYTIEKEEEIPSLVDDGAKVDVNVNNYSPIIEVKDDDEIKVTPYKAKQEPTYEEVEKPKVNIDVDSVVVNNHTNNDDFFDDFFGSEDE